LYSDWPAYYTYLKKSLVIPCNREEEKTTGQRHGRKKPAPWPQIREFLDLVKAFCEVVDVNHADRQLGLEIAEHYRLQIFDSMLLATATRIRCSTMLSEDIQMISFSDLYE